MNARWLAVSVALLAAGQPAFAEDARSRGTSGGGSSSAGERHHSSSSGSSNTSSSSSSHHVSGPSSSSGSSSPVLTDAQRRHPRAGTGTGYHNSYSGRYGYGGYGFGYGYRYRPYYGGYGYYPWGGLYLDGYWGGPSYSGYYGRPYYGGGYYVRSYRDTGSVRVLVDQHRAGVFVDGYYAGIVDDYDGIFQRLYVSPGHHLITVKLEGYQTHTFDVYVPYDGTLKLHWDMVRGSGDDGTGDPTLNAGRRGPRDEREGRYEGGTRDDRYRRDDNERYGRSSDDRDNDAPVDDRYAPGDEDRYAPGDEKQSTPQDESRWPRERSAGQGSLHLNVRPADASIYVDGAFRGTARELADLDLASGPHRLEILRPGYRTIERDVTVESGRSVDLSVSLER